MSNYLTRAIIFGTIFTCSVSYAATTNEKQEAIACDTIMAYQPGGSSLLEARNSFQTELEILLNSCNVQKKYPTKKNANYFLNSFSESGNKKVLVYKLLDFADDSKPMESICTLTETTAYTPAPARPDGMWNEGSWTTDVSQTCTTPIVAK